MASKSTQAGPAVRKALGAGDFLVLTATSVFGLGYAPRAPGTVGTLAGLPLWWALSGLNVTSFVAVLALFTAVSCMLSARAETIYGSHDVQRIVLDEVVGFLCTVIAIPCTLQHGAWAFVLFRLLDALKPGPIGWVDRHVPGGTGVVMDDVAAGLAGCALLHGARFLQLLP